MSLLTVAVQRVPNPYVHHLSFTVKEGLPANVVIKAGYAGKLGHNLLRMNQINPARYIAGQSTVANTDSRCLYMPGVFGSIREVAGNSNSSYHALQLMVNKRLGRGLTATGSYTFGKYLDYYSATNLGQFPQDPFNMRADPLAFRRRPQARVQQLVLLRDSCMARAGSRRSCGNRRVDPVRHGHAAERASAPHSQRRG
jgi:hypothetical protein